jgi:hypothetical protein
MTPKDKSKEILTKIEIAFYGKSYAPKRYSRKIVKLALIMVDELIRLEDDFDQYYPQHKFWVEVKKQIERE